MNARPDPTQDPNLRGLVDAQAETARRFARSQVSNFMRRAEQLHGGGGSTDPSMGITLTSRDGRSVYPQRPTLDGATMAITERMRPSGASVDDVAIDNRTDDAEAEWSGGSWKRAEAGGVAGHRRSATATDKASAIADGTAAAPGAGTGIGDGPGTGSGERRIGAVALWSAGAIEIGTRNAETDRTKITATTSGLSGGADIKLAEGLTVGLGGGIATISA
ncbi:hypothetical protein ACG3SL_04630 [Sphingomonas sp. CJ20]